MNVCWDHGEGSRNCSTGGAVAALSKIPGLGWILSANYNLVLRQSNSLNFNYSINVLWSD